MQTVEESIRRANESPPRGRTQKGQEDSAVAPLIHGPEELEEDNQKTDMACPVSTFPFVIPCPDFRRLTCRVSVRRQHVANQRTTPGIIGMGIWFTTKPWGVEYSPRSSAL
jgi:hypothetical protein